MLRIKFDYLAPKCIKPRERAWRTHPPAQLELLRQSLRQNGFVEPVLIDSRDRIVCGAGMVEAAIAEGVDLVPVIRAEHLNDKQLRAYAVAANKLAERAGYDETLLAEELQQLSVLLEEPDLSWLGFEQGELDQLLGLTDVVGDDEQIPPLNSGKPIAAVGEVYQIGCHRLACCDALNPASYDLLMQGEKAQLAFADFPYNLPAKAFSGSGRFKHGNFLQGFGELSSGQYTRFVTEGMRQNRAHMSDGALGLYFINGKCMLEMLRAGSIVFGVPKNIITWVKSQGGQGSLWRSQTEFVVCFKNGSAPHVNNIMLGKHGRNRSNAWFYQGMNTPSAERDKLLASHPTCKPTDLLADAILDVTTQGSIVLDTFAGSGSIIVAAERVKRRAFAMEVDPRYVDVALRRARSTLGLDPVRISDGALLSELEEG